MVMAHLQIDLLSRDRFMSVAVGLLGIWIAAFIITSILTQVKRFRAPRVGKDPRRVGLLSARADFVKNGKVLTRQGYEQHKDGMYWIQTGDMDRLVLSTRYINALRKLSDSHIDSKQAVVQRNLGWYNRVDVILKSTAHVDVCRKQLVQNLDKITQGQIEELPAIFHDELNECFHDNKFHYYNAANKLLHIVNRTAARMLVGKSLCHEEGWLNGSLETTVNTGLLCRNLQPYPGFLRSLVFPFLKSRRTLNNSFDQVQGLLSPMIESRCPGDENVDILQWLIDSYKGAKINVPFLTNQVLFVAIASVRSTATATVNALFDLAAYPEYQEPLRQEIDVALAKEGGWCLAALERMKKLDSFIKESQRTNHHLLLSFNRVLRQPVTLEDGIRIPEGTFISTPAYWAARDADIFPGGEEFRPWRWLKMRNDAEKQDKSITPFLASSTSPENLFWGWGRNACPGRFMAATEMKLLLAWTLHYLDISFPDRQTDRPPPYFVDERVFPDPAQDIGFRLRREM